MKINFTLFTTLFLLTLSSNAQFSAEGEFRPRAEYRNGYGNLILEDQEPGFGISTRARLNFGYKSEGYNLFVSLQDVIVWGENRQLLPEDKNNTFAIFQAWADLKLGSNMMIKLGRQEISYDDQRIMGGLDWAQQGRNHDAAILKYNKDKFTFDLGLAFNQDYDNISGFQSVGNMYNTTGFFSYKTMQYAYLKNSWNSFSGSLLLLNNGFQETDNLSYLQTIGTHLNYKKGKFGASANVFLQSGKRQGEVDVKGAYLASLDFSYKTSEKITLELGAEIISGNNKNAGETGAFFPLYGTNHKFNGFMDYFYVGNHANTIGLIDVHASLNIYLNKDTNLLIKALNFSGEQALPNGEKSLGTEVDLVYSKKFKGYSLVAGYSQMFASDGMYELKGVSENLASYSQNWAWVMLVIKPKFL
ncbi:MAG: alginate export family protein [Lutibacter sp.]|jgi:hypothetical protein|nr:alginate export family protein [Lutibacter sp.]